MIKGPSPSRLRISLIHATTLSMDPAKQAFTRLWPEAYIFHVLDNSLSDDRNAAGELSGDLRRRIDALAGYALSCGADGILYSCSAFGEAIEDVARRQPVPVFKPNEAMFEDALDLGAEIAMLATFPPSVPGMEQEFREQAGARGVSASLTSTVMPEARAALLAGDAEGHNRLLADAAEKIEGADAIVLAHFSMDRAVAAISGRTGIPVLSPPSSAVSRFRSLLEPGSAPGRHQHHQSEPDDEKDQN